MDLAMDQKANQLWTYAAAEFFGGLKSICHFEKHAEVKGVPAMIFDTEFSADELHQFLVSDNMKQYLYAFENKARDLKKAADERKAEEAKAAEERSKKRKREGERIKEMGPTQRSQELDKMTIDQLKTIASSYRIRLARESKKMCVEKILAFEYPNFRIDQ